MSFEDSRIEVIDRLVDYVTQKLPKDEAPLIKNFVRQYYLSVSAEDLATRSMLDLYGAVVSHWHYIYHHKPGEPKVRAFNPQLEKDGWQSTHTIIEISFDDMPFLVDSVSIALHRMNLNIHLIIHMGSLKLYRDAAGIVLKIADKDCTDPNVISEAAIYIEVDRQSDPEILTLIEKELKKVLLEVQTVVKDWPKMRDTARAIIENLWDAATVVDKKELDESVTFLRWITEDHFTFLGYQSYKMTEAGGHVTRKVVSESILGMLKFQKEGSENCLVSELPLAAQELLNSHHLLMFGKTNIRSTVHRPVYADFVSIKQFNSKGRVSIEHRFVGLYTAGAYNSSTKQIPLFRQKVADILHLAGFAPKSHDDRTLLNILETLPRDDLIQGTEKQLLELATGILHLQERQRIRLFVRVDTFGYFVSCLVFVPRDKFTSVLGQRMQEILLHGFDGSEVEMETRFSESLLARIHFVVRVDPKKNLQYDVKNLEDKLVETARTWQDDLIDALVEHCGEERGNDLFKRFQNAFPAGYRESFPARSAVVDIEYFETLRANKPLAMSLYRPLEELEEVIRFKLFRRGKTIPLSDVVPILENMGLRIISERPYEITPKNGEGSIWINDYRMVHKKGGVFNTDTIKDIFQEAFDHIWSGKAENDGFNRLVLGAKLTWREIMVLRAYAKYLWQTGFTFSQDHVEDTFSANPNIAVLLIELFRLRFNPEHHGSENDQLNQKQKIEQALEKVDNLNEDRILRRYMYTILATIRTNYYQTDVNQIAKPYFSFKLRSEKVPELPLPVPLFEIFGYSPRVEYIHLRVAKVARGGIRWSDRREDFRTEILGLMKTQQVKNAVIVPMGAKGGFVVKQMPVLGSREQMMEEVVYCYQTMIRGLLDLTDNYVGSEVVHPPQVVRYDEDDPYLVVAADKGTATFSDIANAISKEYGFWLGDAFASGGATGYDHKKMGITARGAWESVKRHFQALAIDPQTQDFTVVGIGDMAGDVFGNGMLLSKHIKLIAAFNHMHIFIDPNPNPLQTFQERKRLFELPRSMWSDFNPALISKGGGVYSRSLKSITLSREAQKALDFYQEQVIPNELIQAILKAPVDLLWNGGIGTYVKAKTETNLMVGDRANDALRINGVDLRCRVVGEGGNLGFTQFGRVEYAKLGGHLNTDAIDNSGGVNCSDNEVNIKILLNGVVAKGDLTEKQRNEILAEVQDEVAELVLKNNREQTKAISVSVSQAVVNLEMHGRLIHEMERAGKLDRVLECLPDKEEIALRKVNKQGLTRPEIAVLMAYTKNILKVDLLASDLPDDPYFQQELIKAFPVPLQNRFLQYMPEHRLRREIIATQISNDVINDMGINFVSRLQDETSGEVPDIIRAYMVARKIFKSEELHEAIDYLNITIDTIVQHKMLQEVNRLVRRGARWFLRNKREGFDISQTIAYFTPLVAEVSDALPGLLTEDSNEMTEMTNELIAAHVPKELACRIGGMSAMFSALDVVEAAFLNKLPIKVVSAIYFAIGTTLQLGWFREVIKKRPVMNHWEALARATFRDDLDRQQRSLTINILRHNGQTINDPKALIDKWLAKHQVLVTRWEYFITELRNSPDPDFTMFAVALRELLDMGQASTSKMNKIKD